MKGDIYAVELIRLVYQNTDVPLIGDAAGLQNSATAGSLYVSLHTADPSAGDQTTNEVSYGGYARVASARNSMVWTNHADGVQNGTALEFVTVASGGATVTHIAIGTSLSGTGKILDVVELDFPLIIAITNIPTIPIGYLILSYKQA